MTDDAKPRPDRRRYPHVPTDAAAAVSRINFAAARAFYGVAARFPWQTDMTELSTETPADWTKGIQ